jgi:hypothetical protein
VLITAAIGSPFHQRDPHAGLINAELLAFIKAQSLRAAA